MSVPVGTICPNQLVHAVLVEPPKVGINAFAAAGSVSIKASPSWMTDWSKPDRPRPA
jgi:hypothetical protein